MLIFLSPYKNGCLKEQQFIIKMLKLLENNENISFVIIKYYDPSTYEADLINSIHKRMFSIMQNLLFLHVNREIF